MRTDIKSLADLWAGTLCLDLDKNRVKGTDDGAGEPFDLSIREFMDVNADDFNDDCFMEDFLFSLADKGVFLYPACMSDVPIVLNGGA